MNILKAGLFSGVATAARLASGLLVLKLVAYYAGPTGVAKLGQFMSLMSLLVVVAGGGLSTGLVKYVAQYKERNVELDALLRTGLLYTLVASLLTGVAVLIFSKPLTLLLFGSIEYESLVWVLAIAQGMMAFNNYVIGVVNGFLDVKRVAVMHIVGAILSLALTAALTSLFQLYGALLGLVLGQASLVLVSVTAIRRTAYFRPSFFRPKLDLEKLSLLVRFSVMTLLSAALPPLIHIWVRNYLEGIFSWTEVGYWQSVSRVSDAYLLFITMAINVYYLPKLSEITDRSRFIQELKTAYVWIMPVVILLSSGIYLLRDWITIILFAPDFLPATPLFGPQLAGDVIKIASYILSYIMLAKALTKTFMILELVFGATYIVWTYLMTQRFGLMGTMYAFVINYAMYLVCTACVAANYIKGMPNKLAGNFEGQVDLQR